MDDQLAKMIERGLVVEDEDEAKHYLYNAEFIGWEPSQPCGEPSALWTAGAIGVLAGVALGAMLLVHAVWSGPVQNHIETEVWADE